MKKIIYQRPIILRIQLTYDDLGLVFNAINKCNQEKPNLVIVNALMKMLEHS